MTLTLLMLEGISTLETIFSDSRSQFSTCWQLAATIPLFLSSTSQLMMGPVLELNSARLSKVRVIALLVTWSSLICHSLTQQSIPKVAMTWESFLVPKLRISKMDPLAWRAWVASGSHSSSVLVLMNFMMPSSVPNMMYLSITSNPYVLSMLTKPLISSSLSREQTFSLPGLIFLLWSMKLLVQMNQLSLIGSTLLVSDCESWLQYCKPTCISVQSSSTCGTSLVLTGTSTSIDSDFPPNFSRCLRVLMQVFLTVVPRSTRAVFVY